jgi:hypothetical protein
MWGAGAGESKISVTSLSMVHVSWFSPIHSNCPTEPINKKEASNITAAG